MPRKKRIYYHARTMPMGGSTFTPYEDVEEDDEITAYNEAVRIYVNNFWRNYHASHPTFEQQNEEARIQKVQEEKDKQFGYNVYQGHSLQMAGEHKEACAYFDAAIKIRPTNVNVRLNKIVSLINLEEYAAAKQLAKYILTQEDNQKAHRYLGLAYWGLKKYQKAENILRNTVEKFPQFADAWVSLGDVLCILNKNMEGIYAYHITVKKAEHGSDARKEAKNRLQNLFQSYSQAELNEVLLKAARLGMHYVVELTLHYGADSHYYKPNDYFRKNAVHKAAKSGQVDCLWELTADQQMVEKYDVYGQTPLHYAAFNANVDCVKLLLEKGANVNAVDYQGNNALHQVASSYGALPTPSKKDVKKCIDLLLEYNEDCLLAKNNQGKTPLEMSMQNESYAKITKYINSYRLTRQAEQLIDEKQYEKAIEMLDQAVQEYRNNARCWNDKAFVCNQLNQHDDAIKNSQMAIRLHRKYANPWRHQGNAHYALHNYSRALECYEKALKLNPNYEAAESDKARCTNQLDIMAFVQHTVHDLKIELENYTEKNKKRIDNFTILRYTFFYDAELSAAKLALANELLNSINNTNFIDMPSSIDELESLIDFYMKESKKKAAAREHLAASFDTLLKKCHDEIANFKANHDQGKPFIVSAPPQ